MPVRVETLTGLLSRVAYSDSKVYCWSCGESVTAIVEFYSDETRIKDFPNEPEHRMRICARCLQTGVQMIRAVAK